MLYFLAILMLENSFLSLREILIIFISGTYKSQTFFHYILNILYFTNSMGTPLRYINLAVA
jgi:hypothetical protein